jgi:hypothetical protein
MRTVAAGLLFTIYASAADREFRDVVDAISDRVHQRPMHIPMFGLVNFVTYIARPAGTKHIDLAVFEDIRGWGNSRALADSIRDAVGGAWKPFVQTRSADEVVFVYMRPVGNDCKLLVVSVERHEATVVQLELNPDALARWVTLPRESILHRKDGGL